MATTNAFSLLMSDTEDSASDNGNDKVSPDEKILDITDSIPDESEKKPEKKETHSIFDYGRRFRSRKPLFKPPEKEHNASSHKRMLCFNILNTGSCPYMDKCAYAHHLGDQKVDPARKEAYDLLMGKDDLSDYDMVGNRHIYHNLKQLTNLCQKCAVGFCPGGYNCKFGSFCKEYQVCRRDFIDGNCEKDCGMVHLTKRGLVPYHIQISRTQRPSYLSKARLASNDRGLRQLRRALPTTRSFASSKRRVRPPVSGVQLTDNFFRKNPQKLADDSDSDISMSDDDIEKVRKYLTEDGYSDNVSDSSGSLDGIDNVSQDLSEIDPDIAKILNL